MITLEKLNRAEAKRYLGGSKIELDEKMNELFESCEKQVISTAKPAYLYKVIDLPNDELFIGNDVKNHLNGCANRQHPQIYRLGKKEGINNNI